MDKKAGRKKGIVVDLDKLEQAMEIAGFRSQMELASSIAAHEGITNPPKDLVNKIFTGKRVAPSSVKRVAAVLGTDSDSLQQKVDQNRTAPAVPTFTKEDAEKSQVSPQREPSADQSRQPNESLTPKHARVPKGNEDTAAHINSNTLQTASYNPKSKKWLLLLSCSIFIAIISITYQRFSLDTPSGTEPNPEKKLATIAVQEWGKEYSSHFGSEEIAEGLAEQLNLDQSLRAKVYSRSANASNAAPELLLYLNVDYVIAPRIFESERHLGLAVNLVGGNINAPIYYNVWHKLGSKPTNRSLYTDIANIINSVVSNPESIINSLSTIEVEKLLNLTIHGEKQLDGAHIDTLLANAETKFNEALRIDPNFVPARAGLCQTLAILNYVRTDNTYLTYAEQECSKIAKPHDLRPEVQTSLANIMRYRGELESSITLFKEVLQQHPNHVEAHMGLAEALRSYAAKYEKQTALHEADKILQLATTIEPNFWRIPFTQSRISHFLGEQSDSILHGERSIELDKNFWNLSNTATFHFCSGSMERAKEIYQQLLDLNISDPMAYGQLASSYYFTGNYQKAIETHKVYLDVTSQLNNSPKIEGYLNLADYFYANGNIGEALEFYRKTLSILEEELLVSDNLPLHLAQKLSVESAIHIINKDNEITDNIRNEALNLLNNQLPPDAKTYLLIALARTGQITPGLDLYHELKRECSGYARHPELRDYAILANNNF